MPYRQNILLILIILLIIFISALYLCSIGPYWNITPDSTVYVLAAKSLAAGKGYTIAGNPVKPSPPLTSLIFSPFILFFPGNYLVLNAVVKVFALLSIYLFFLFFKGKLGNTKSLFLILLSLSSTSFFYESTRLLSELFYMFFAILGLIMAEESTKKSYSFLNYFLFGTVVFLACMTRIAGLALATAILISSLISLNKEHTERKYTSILIMILVIFIYLLWELRNCRLGISFTQIFFQNLAWVKSSGYVSPMGLLKRFLSNFKEGWILGKVLTNNILYKIKVAKILLYSSTLILCLIGLATSLKKQLNVVNLYVSIYLLFMILVPSPDFARYSIPVLPFLFYFAFLGLEYIAKHTRIIAGPIIPKIIYSFVTIFILLYIGFGLKYIIKNIPKEHRSQFGAYPIKLANADLQRLEIWLRDRSSKTETYVCLNPIVPDLITERKGYDFPVVTEPSALLNFLQKNKIRYIFIDKRRGGRQQDVFSLMKTLPNKFILVEDKKEASLYEFKQ